jgi:cardiolipin synthase
MLRHLPNLITLLRIALVVPLCWLIETGRADLAWLVAAIAGLSDALDGLLAKRFGWQTWIGGMLDPVADKLLLTASFIWLARAGGLPAWLALLVVGRDVIIVSGAVLYHVLFGRFQAEPSLLSKTTTVLQIALVLVVLLHLSRWITLGPAVQALLFVIVAAATVASGVHYIVAWSLRARRSAAMRRGAGR